MNYAWGRLADLETHLSRGYTLVDPDKTENGFTVQCSSTRVEEVLVDGKMTNVFVRDGLLPKDKLCLFLMSEDQEKNLNRKIAEAARRPPFLARVKMAFRILFG